MSAEEHQNDYGNLEELGGSNYEIADNEPDIKGWDVRNKEGKKIGEVDELLFNPLTRKVRYIVVDMEDNDLDLEEERRALIPIGIVQLQGNEDNVIIPEITEKQLSELPPYEKGGVTPAMEMEIRNIFEGTSTTDEPYTTPMADTDDFYNHPHFDEDRFYQSRPGSTVTDKFEVIKEDLHVGKQNIETEGTRVNSRLIEKPVEEKLTLRHEHVDVERRSADRAVSPSDTQIFQEQEFELIEHAEVPVVKKEARVVEEVYLNKRVEEREETIRDTLRETRVETEKLEPDHNERADLP